MPIARKVHVQSTPSVTVKSFCLFLHSPITVELGHWNWCKQVIYKVWKVTLQHYLRNETIKVHRSPELLNDFPWALMTVNEQLYITLILPCLWWPYNMTWLLVDKISNFHFHYPSTTVIFNLIKANKMLRTDKQNCGFYHTKCEICST